MAIVDTYPIFFPPQPHHANVNMNVGTLVSNQADEDVALIIRIIKAGTLSKVHFRLTAVGTAKAMRVSFQNVSGNDPDLTEDQFRTIAIGAVSAGIVSSGLITDDGSDTGVERVVSVGDIVAVNFGWDADGDPGDVTFGCWFAAGNFNIHHHAPYGDVRANGTTWSPDRGKWPFVALEYDDGSYMEAWWPMFISANASNTFNSGSDPDERGIRFQVPFTCRAFGAWMLTDANESGNIKLYSDDAVTTHSTAVVEQNVDSGSANGYQQFYFDNPFTLIAGTWYRLAFAPDAAVTSASIVEFDVDVAARMACHPLGVNCYHTERTDGGSFSDITTKRTMIGVIANGLEDGVAAASGMFGGAHPGMNGGLNG